MWKYETVDKILKDKTKKHVIVEFCDDCGRVKQSNLWFRLSYLKNEVGRRQMTLGSGYCEPISQNSFGVILCTKRAYKTGGGWHYDAKALGMRERQPEPYGDVERLPHNPDALMRSLSYLKTYVDKDCVIDIDVPGQDAYQVEKVLKMLGLGTVVNHKND